jgi:small-conductance mechanosensitive channel
MIVRRVGRSKNLNPKRTELVLRYMTTGLITIALVALTLIWGVNVMELGFIFSSVFAVMGIALFASWSILSNVTAGIILFLNFPFKIGDRIRILDKDLDMDKEFLIEDIKAFHIHLRTKKGHLITYPNSLMLQKGVFQIENNPQKPVVEE